MIAREKFVPESEVAPRVEHEPRPSIPEEVELEFPVGAKISQKGSKARLEIDAYDYRYGIVYLKPDVRFRPEKHPKWMERFFNKELRDTGKAMAKLKKAELKVFSVARDSITGEPMAKEEIAAYAKWSEQNPDHTVVSAEDLVPEKSDIVRDVNQGDHQQYNGMQFMNRKSGEVVQITAADPEARVFVLRSAGGKELQLSPQDVFYKHDLVEGERVPMPGDNWIGAEPAKDRMKQEEVAVVNYTNLNSRKVCYTNPDTGSMVMADLKEFQDKFIHEPF